MKDVQDFAKNMPPLRRERNPTTAAIIGFLFGGIGLGFYLASFIDFLIPIVIVIVLSSVLSQYGYIGGAIIAAVWGYFRAVSSNEKIAQTRRQYNSTSEVQQQRNV